MKLKAAPKKPAPKTMPAKPLATKAAAKATAKPAPKGKAAPGAARDHATLHAFEAGLPKGEKPIIYVNGRLVPKSQAMVSVYDHGLLYGDGVFEGIRVYKGKIFKCGQHMERLWRCAEMIRLRIPISRDDMVQVMRDCIEANGLQEGYIRLVVSRGYGTLGLDPRKCPVAGVICIADQIALYPPEAYERGMKIIVAKRPRTPIECLDPRLKSLNYLNNILAKVEAIDQGCDEAIMLNLDGYVGECTGDNLFIVRDGRVFTPPTEAGLLEGITRRFVMDLCAEMDIPCTLKSMRPEEVKSADEVFLTGSAAEIIAVTQIDDIKIGHGSEGPVTKRLRSRFRSVVTGAHVPED
jgi:branched-chain amino acid aminotransferase